MTPANAKRARTIIIINLLADDVLRTNKKMPAVYAGTCRIYKKKEPSMKLGNRTLPPYYGASICWRLW
jgi:hypothetical protein